MIPVVITLYMHVQGVVRRKIRDSKFSSQTKLFTGDACDAN